MKRKLLGFLVLALAATTLLNLASCGHNQHLIAITVNPQGTTITQCPGQQVQTQFTALGTYIHPPETRDITSTAIWSTDAPQFLQVESSPPGLIQTTGNGSGTNLGVSATVYTDGDMGGNVVVGTSAISITFSSSCP